MFLPTYHLQAQITTTIVFSTFYPMQTYINILCIKIKTLWLPCSGLLARLHTSLMMTYAIQYMGEGLCYLYRDQKWSVWVQLHKWALHRQRYYPQSAHNEGWLGICSVKLNVYITHMACQRDLRCKITLPSHSNVRYLL